MGFSFLKRKLWVLDYILCKILLVDAIEMM